MGVRPTSEVQEGFLEEAAGESSPDPGQCVPWSFQRGQARVEQNRGCSGDQGSSAGEAWSGHLGGQVGCHPAEPPEAQQSRLNLD